MKIKIVGLTGQTGSGKSEVAKLLVSQGIDVIDCDKISHNVSDTEKSCLCDLALEFSISILNLDGTLNRKKLASIVFGDKAKLKRLNEIIFPYIKAEIASEIKKLDKKGKPLVILDAPTLFESGLNKDCDFIISVVAPLEERISRIVVRDHLTDEEARKRISSQHDEEFFISNTDAVIENKGSLSDLKESTAKAVEKMCITFSQLLKGEEKQKANENAIFEGSNDEGKEDQGIEKA